MYAKVDSSPLKHSIPFSQKLLDSVFGKIFIAATQTVLGSVILLLIFVVRQTVDIFVLKYAIVMAVGLLAGFSARRFLKENTQFLKLLVALISVSLSLATLYLLSGGFIGISLFSPGRQSSDWAGLMEFAFSALGAWMVLGAFRRKNSIVQTPISKPSLKPVLSLRNKISTWMTPRLKRLKSWIPTTSHPTIKRIDKKLSRFKSKLNESIKVGKSGSLKLLSRGARHQAPAKISVSRQSSTIPKPAKKIKKPGRAKKKEFWKNKTTAEIKFFGQQEHSCPYCLEPVETSDPRGVKVCSTCNTHHHADCWGVTGACQVPHAQE